MLLLPMKMPTGPLVGTVKLLTVIIINKTELLLMLLLPMKMRIGGWWECCIGCGKTFEESSKTNSHGQRTHGPFMINRILMIALWAIFVV